MAKELPTIERLYELLDCDFENGTITWRVRRRGVNVGKVAGSLQTNGYRYIRVDRKLLLYHRVVWAMSYGAWPDSDIDHIDMNPANNRLANLRVATDSENMRNRRAQINNTSGVKGLCFDKTNNLWKGQIWLTGKNHTKSSKDRAIVESWLAEKRRELHGEFARD